MTAVIINGKQMAADIRAELKSKIKSLPTPPVLAIIQVGNDEASTVYVRNKQKAAAEVGISTCFYGFEENCTQKELLSLIQNLNKDHEVNGILVQLPLPKQINEQEILDSIDYKKDVDGFHPYNVGLLQNGYKKALLAATPKGIMHILDTVSTDLSGKHALVIGCSIIVGKPTAMLLLQRGCTVTLAHDKTVNLAELVKQADILVVACGCPEMVKGSWVKEGAVIIDVGINRLNGRLCGDVEFTAACNKASYITPVPGGVGPLTVAMLLENTFEAYKAQNNL